MLNEERIKLMTQLASYEKNDGKKNVAIGSFFRGDYLSLQLIKSIIYGSVAYLIVFGIYMYYNFESIMDNVYSMDLIGLGTDIIKYYVIFIVAYCIISYFIYSVRYSQAMASLKNYYNNLKHLEEFYSEENRK